MTALYLTAMLKRFETTTLLRGGVFDPVGPFRFTPFPRGETLKRLRASLTVWRRVSELKRTGKIRQTGLRRKNESGMTATMWRLTNGLAAGPTKSGGE
jgi:hypothetical protein